MKTITEGAAVIQNETAKVVSKDLPVFYNPVMKHNRDMSLLLLAGEGRKLQCCDLLAGSGVRSIRMLKEIPNMVERSSHELSGKPPTVIEHVTINDADKETFKRIKKNLKENDLDAVHWELKDFINHSVKTDGPGSRERDPYPLVTVSNLDANQLLLSSNGYDYIDIDPFGSPNAFLDAACKRIARKGILALTFTDTSSLAGSYPDACERKYWGMPCDGPRKHEVGLRLAIRKVQLVAAQYDKALTPILVYNKDHYYRAYFRVEKGKKKCDALLAQHGTWDDEPESGPLWLGKMRDSKIIERMIKTLKEWSGPKTDKSVEEIVHWLETLGTENNFELGHYYYLNDLNKELKTPVKKEKLLELLGKKGSAVHYTGDAIKSSLTIDEIKAIVQDKK